MSLKSAVYNQERFQIKRGLWWHAYGRIFLNLKVTLLSTYLTAKMETFEELVQFWFENHSNLTKSEFKNDWIDPYDSIWLKLLSVIIYAMEIFESIVMITFINYENAGLFGHYRTLINQLLSHLYGGVSTFFGNNVGCNYLKLKFFLFSLLGSILWCCSLWITKFPSNLWAYACFILQSELSNKQNFNDD